MCMAQGTLTKCCGDDDDGRDAAAHSKAISLHVFFMSFQRPTCNVRGHNRCELGPWQAQGELGRGGLLVHPGDHPLGRESSTPCEGQGMLSTTTRAKGQPHRLHPPSPAPPRTPLCHSHQRRKKTAGKAGGRKAAACFPYRVYFMTFISLLSLFPDPSLSLNVKF